jgi:hypothetical protein
MGLLFNRPIRYIDLLYNVPFVNLQPFFISRLPHRHIYTYYIHRFTPYNQQTINTTTDFLPIR